MYKDGCFFICHLRFLLLELYLFFSLAVTCCVSEFFITCHDKIYDNALIYSLLYFSNWSDFKNKM